MFTRAMEEAGGLPSGSGREQNGRSRKKCNGTNRITEDIKLSSRRIARLSIGRRGPKSKAGVNREKRKRERERGGGEKRRERGQ